MSNCCNDSRLDSDPTAILINDRRRTGWADHDRVADIGLDPAVDRLEALTPIDREVALEVAEPFSVLHNRGCRVSFVAPLAEQRSQSCGFREADL